MDTVLMRPDRSQAALYAYWQPGCTSCLRMKEFLASRGVRFVSVNVLEDKKGLEELLELGPRTVPILRRGRDWVDGQVLEEVARLAGIPYKVPAKLRPPELAARADLVLGAAKRFFEQIPEADCGKQLPSRTRTYSELAYHIFNIADSFLEHEIEGRPFVESCDERIPSAGESKTNIAAYGEDVRTRFANWWAQSGATTDFERSANVYYGNVSVHDFLERTVWHSGQHTRQMLMVLGILGIEPDQAARRRRMEGFADASECLGLARQHSWASIVQWLEFATSTRPVGTVQ